MTPLLSRIAAVTVVLFAGVAYLRSVYADAATSQAVSQATATGDEVRARCIVCHAVPQPDILPRASWRDALARMMLIQEGVPEPTGAIGMIPLSPDWMRILRHYQERAPEKLPEPQPWPPVDGRLDLKRRSVATPKHGGAVAVANVRFLHMDADKRLDIVASDMRSGHVVGGLAKNDFALSTVAQLRHPAHLEQVDLDKDGVEDLLVGDLGSFLPADHQDGAVYWLRGTREGFRPVVLASGLARVADVRAADFDGDGDLDVIAGVFGWRRTGNITLLENRTTNWNAPAFVSRVVDKRTGSIHVPIADVNRDGKPDFIALLAQEHESVVAFVNTGNLEFAVQTIYAAPHPNWGSSGIELVDLDRDGDQDVLMTNGDAFDDFIVKPYHGIQWLENTGSYPYVPHWLAQLPGAHRAQAADVDGDGDLDIVVAVMIAGGEMRPQLASLVWLEQVRPGVFERRTLEAGTPYHATLDIGDYNGDGKPDLAVGWFAVDQRVSGWIDLWTSSPP
jgi:hypothetical protein